MCITHRGYRGWYGGLQLANGQAAAARDEALHQGLLRMVRKRPKYERNLPHLCSFYARGECNRGSECPYRHEMPRPKDDLSKQNIVDRFHGRNDPVAKRMLARSKGKAQFAHPPTPQAKTLWLAPINATTTQSDIQCVCRCRLFLCVCVCLVCVYVYVYVCVCVCWCGGCPLPPPPPPSSPPHVAACRDKFYAYGEILSIKLIPDKSCAFVEYATQAQAVEACKALYASLDLNGVPTKVAWAHPPRPRGAPPQLTAGTAAPGTGVVIPPPPPRKGAAAKASTRGAASGAGAGAGTGAGNSAAGAGASTPSAPTAPAAAPTAVQFPAYMLKAMPAPPGLRPGMKVPPPPKGVPAYAGVIPPPPPRKKSSGPVRREKSKVARTQAHPYASMDPRAMGSRVNMT